MIVTIDKTLAWSAGRLGVLKCRKCGRDITRKQGNLRSRASLYRAVESLLRRHEAKCTGEKIVTEDVGGVT